MMTNEGNPFFGMDQQDSYGADFAKDFGVADFDLTEFLKDDPDLVDEVIRDLDYGRVDLDPKLEGIKVEAEWKIPIKTMTTFTPIQTSISGCNASFGVSPTSAVLRPTYTIATAPIVVPKPETPFDAYIQAPESVKSFGLYEQQGGVTPKMKRPRKYTMKPEEIKKKPEYKEKRQRNNEAVRKSREKARQQQMEKDAILEQLQQENTDLRSENDQLRQQLDVFYNHCACGVLVDAVEVLPAGH